MPLQIYGDVGQHRPHLYDFIWSLGSKWVPCVFHDPLSGAALCFCVFFLLFIFFLIIISTTPLQGPSGWAGASEPMAALGTHVSLQSHLQFYRQRNHTRYAGRFQHTQCLLTVTHTSVGRVSGKGEPVSTIIPASMVGGARRRSLGRAAGCIAPCQSACPGCHSCSCWAADHWAFDTRPDESSFLHRSSGCTEVREKKSFLIIWHHYII